MFLKLSICIHFFVLYSEFSGGIGSDFNKYKTLDRWCSKIPNACVMSAISLSLFIFVKFLDKKSVFYLLGKCKSKLKMICEISRNLEINANIVLWVCDLST